MEEVLDAFETLKKACLKAPVLAFADFNKPFLLETDVSKLGLGAVLFPEKSDGQYHLVAYASQSLTIHEHKYHSMKQEFLALKCGQLQASFRNTYSGNHLLSELTTIYSLASWLCLI